MDFFTTVMNLASRGVIAFGGFWVVWGIIVLAGGIKDKTAPEIKQGIGQIVGGAMIVIAGAYITQIKL